MRTIIAAALLAAVSATPAFAQDAPAGNFSGGHAEVLFGGDRASADGANSNGMFVGIGAGWDFQSGNGVFGVELEASDPTTDFCDAGICVEATRDLYAGGRAGFVIQDQVLLYGKLGYSNARVAVEDGAGNSVAATNLDGIRGGVGAEWHTGSPFTVRLEYRYSNYEAGFERHQAVVGAGIRF